MRRIDYDKVKIYTHLTYATQPESNMLMGYVTYYKEYTMHIQAALIDSISGKEFIHADIIEHDPYTTYMLNGCFGHELFPRLGLHEKDVI